jgi:hypothetical protein
LAKPLPFFGIAGFIKIVDGYSVVLITKRKEVGIIGPHRIYTIEETKMIPLTPPSGKKAKLGTGNASPLESKYRKIFSSVDMNKDFYFSYSYDLSNSLQYNMGHPSGPTHTINKRFVFNQYLIEEFASIVGENSVFLVPLVHGTFEQQRISLHGLSFDLTLLGRRSRYFAGTRYLKRGCNDAGNVANEIETEQIVYNRFVGNLEDGSFSSYLQVRGSIPLFWSNGDVNTLTPKLPIVMLFVDPFYQSTRLHFKNLIERYGTPVTVLSLIKQAEKKGPREGVLGLHFGRSIEYVNTTISSDMRIRYVPFDYHSISRKKPLEAIQQLSNNAEDHVDSTGFFFSGSPSQVQTGIVRSNCIDSIDRTNIAQMCIGKVVLGRQLTALGILPNAQSTLYPLVYNVLYDMYMHHGNKIALQYGGSNALHQTRSLGAKGTTATKSKDMMNLMKRYYNNAFLDAERQDAMNLFLGIYRPSGEDAVQLWDLHSDVSMHQLGVGRFRLDDRFWAQRAYKRYQEKVLPKMLSLTYKENLDVRLYAWNEMYEPWRITCFDELLTHPHESAVIDVGKDIEKEETESEEAEGTEDFAVLRSLWTGIHKSFDSLIDSANAKSGMMRGDKNSIPLTRLIGYTKKDVFQRYGDVKGLGNRLMKPNYKKVEGYRAYLEDSHAFSWSSNIVSFERPNVVSNESYAQPIQDEDLTQWVVCSDILNVLEQERINEDKSSPPVKSSRKDRETETTKEKEKEKDKEKKEHKSEVDKRKVNSGIVHWRQDAAKYLKYIDTTQLGNIQRLESLPASELRIYTGGGP